MNVRSVRIFYWATFLLSVIIIPHDLGLGLITVGLFILPVLVLHIEIGLSLNRINGCDILIAFSAINLLVFALIRPDGAHAFTDNGLSAALGIVGIDSGYNRSYEDYFFFGSLVLLLVQLVVDLKLRRVREAKTSMN